MKALVDTSQRKGPGKSWFTESLRHLDVGRTLWVAEGHFKNPSSIRNSVSQFSRNSGMKFSTRTVDDGYMITRLA